MPKKLQSNFSRRIEKIISSLRPVVPPQGTNHVDDAPEWTQNSIYPGELALNEICGTLWTQDGDSSYQPNTENAILFGLVLTNVGASGTYLAVSDGYARFKGRTYVYKTPSLSNPSSITIESSSGAPGPRIDAIVASPGTTYNESEGLYELEISVVRGEEYYAGCGEVKIWPPIVEEPDENCEGGTFLLGLVYVPANLNQSTTQLYPLSVIDAKMDTATATPLDPDGLTSPFYTTFPFPIVTVNDFIRRRQKSNFEWQQNTLMFENQLLYSKAGGCGTMYYVKKTYQSSSSLATDLSSGNLVEFCSTGGGTSSVDTFSDIGFPQSVGAPSFSDGFYTSWDATTRVIDSIAYLNDMIGKLSPSAPFDAGSFDLELSESMGGFSAKALTGLTKLNIVNDSDTPAIAITPNGKPFRDKNNHCLMFGWYDVDTFKSTDTYDDDVLFDAPEIPTYYGISTSSVVTPGSMSVKISVVDDISDHPMLIEGRYLLIRETADPSNFFYVRVKTPATWLTNVLTIPIDNSTPFSSLNGDFDSYEIYIPNRVVSEDDVLFLVSKVDPYENIDQKNDIYTAFTARVETMSSISASSTMHTLAVKYAGLDSTCDFYVENLNTPSITTTTNPFGILTSNKYISGVPVLGTGDRVRLSIDVDDAVNYFYNKDRIIECTNTSDFQPFSLTDADTSTGAPSVGSPWSSNQTLSFDDVDLFVSSSACGDSLSFNLLAYNARGTDVSDIGNALYETDLIVASETTEIPEIDPTDYNGYVPSSGRYTSGSGTIPTGGVPYMYNTASGWGKPYSSVETQDDLSSTEELQLGVATFLTGQDKCGYYFFPYLDYSSINIYADESLTPVSPLPPDYSGIPDLLNNDYRYATFYAGYIDVETHFVRLRIVDGHNINEDWDGIVMSRDFSFQVKLYDPDSGLQTGWLDANKSYDPSDPNPSLNGDAALDASFAQGPLFRRITFGTTARKGLVWVRIGTRYFNADDDPARIAFRNVVIVNSDSVTEGDGWEYIDTELMPELENIQNLVLSLNGSNFPGDFSDPDSPNTMTPGLELEVKLSGDNGTDWVSANDAYDPYVAEMPNLLGDAALDAGLSTTFNRRVTFGPVVGGRTGFLQIRYRIAEGSGIVLNTIILEEYS
jgi:hypothetical protein